MKYHYSFRIRSIMVTLNGPEKNAQSVVATNGTAYFAFIASQQREIACFRDAFASEASIGAYPNPSLANLSSSRQGAARKATPVHFSLGMLRTSGPAPVTS